MRKTANPAPLGKGRRAPRLTTAISDVSELPLSLSILQRTDPPRRPVRPRVVLDSGLVTSADSCVGGRRLYWLEAVDGHGHVQMVADSFSLRDLQWLALQYQRAGWLVIDRTAGSAA